MVRGKRQSPDLIVFKDGKTPFSWIFCFGHYMRLSTATMTGKRGSHVTKNQYPSKKKVSISIMNVCSYIVIFLIKIERNLPKTNRCCQNRCSTAVKWTRARELVLRPRWTEKIAKNKSNLGRSRHFKGRLNMRGTKPIAILRKWEV